MEWRTRPISGQIKTPAAPMRIKPTRPQRNRLLDANAYRCCVCKRRSIGFHFHHIDGDNANTVDANLAVVCVEDHDRHHRPDAYVAKPNHTELSAIEILKYKTSWERFVAEARQPQPQVLATLSAYGTFEQIHSLQLILQWPDETIALLSLLRRRAQPNSEAGRCHSTDRSCVGYGFLRQHLHQPDPSISRHGLVFALHLCRGSHLHYHDDWIDESVPVDRGSSVRKHATKVVNHLLQEWQPANTFIGTGDYDKPELISNLVLPDCWEVTKA
jgi:hypothetical protein